MKELTEKQQVNAQLNTIVYFEFKELRDTMEWLNCHKAEFSESDAPMLNVKTYEGSYVPYLVRKVTWDDDDIVRINAHKEDSPYRPDEDDDFDCNEWFSCMDEGFRNAVIPGELTELTKSIETEVQGLSKAYSFNSEQQYAILKFNEAAQLLYKVGVSILLDNEDGYTYFLNSNAITDLCQSNEGGRKELQLSSMKETAHIIDFMFFANDGLYARPKSND